jgi:hypothetical protein
MGCGLLCAMWHLCNDFIFHNARFPSILLVIPLAIHEWREEEYKAVMSI